MKRKWWIRTAILLTFCMIFFVVTFLWIAVYGPTGMGETRESHDGKYEASIWNMTDRDWQTSRRNYISIIVVDKSTGRIIWDIKRYHDSSVNVPDLVNADRTLCLLEDGFYEHYRSN